jgi:hypothetical protein
MPQKDSFRCSLYCRCYNNKCPNRACGLYFHSAKLLLIFITGVRCISK